MEKIKDKKVIEKLINIDKIGTLNAVNTMKYEKEWDIYVDNKVNPKGFVVNSRMWNIPFGEDDDVIISMLKGLDYSKEQNFAGVLKKYYDMVKDMKDIAWEEHCYLYYLDKENLDLDNINHEVGSLDVQHVETLDKYYTYKDDESYNYIKECIETRPSSAVFNEKGEPISWCVLREDGTMGIMYTKKEHRGKGLAISVSVDLAKKVIDNGGVPYVHIVTDNNPSINLAETLGFKKYGEIVWFGVKAEK